MTRTLPLTICATIGLIALPAVAGAPRPVAVTTYPSPASALSDAEAAAILAGASELLMKNDGKAADNNGDVPCNLALTPDPAVAEFADVVRDGVISSGADFDEVCHQAGLVHVVNQINWCGDVQDNFLGCSDPRPCIIVIRPREPLTSVMEPVLWAHEYGHAKGLKHSCNSNCTAKHDDRLMHPTIDIPHRKIGGAECAAYLR